jgi:prepilin-type N-terminal cleavage/methylation domain-containing protein
MTPLATRSALPLATRHSLVTPKQREGGSLATRRRPAAFTLIELLVVIAIVAILAGLGFAGISGALNTGRKAEVRAMANQIKVAISAFNAEYGRFPTNATTDAAFLNLMTGSDTRNNPRGIRFLEPPPKFTNSSGIVTPPKFYRNGGQSNFTLVIDTDYDGRITLPPPSGSTFGSVAVHVPDPTSQGKVIGTW